MKKFLFTLGMAVFTLANANAENKDVNGGTKVHDTATVRPVPVREVVTAEAIAEDLKITETVVEYAPLLPGKSPEAVIADDNLIVENTAAKEVFLLDLKENKPKKFKKTLKRTGERAIGSL